jgi:hypothetical protein
MNFKDEEQLLSNKNYRNYLKKKLKIKEKYETHIFPCISGRGYNKKGLTDYQRDEYRKYLKELGDLIWKPNGSFFKFVQDAKPTVEKQQMEMRARGASMKRSTFNYY